jgi:hypothetical protein
VIGFYQASSGITLSIVVEQSKLHGCKNTVIYCFGEKISFGDLVTRFVSL